MIERTFSIKEISDTCCLIKETSESGRPYLCASIAGSLPEAFMDIGSLFNWIVHADVIEADGVYKAVIKGEQ